MKTLILLFAFTFTAYPIAHAVDITCKILEYGPTVRCPCATTKVQCNDIIGYANNESLRSILKIEPSEANVGVPFKIDNMKVLPIYDKNTDDHPAALLKDRLRFSTLHRTHLRHTKAGPFTATERLRKRA